MYFAPAKPSSPRFVGATIATIVTAAALYVTSISHLGFGHAVPKPVDFTNSISSDASGGSEPKTVMVPDTSIGAPPPSGEPSDVVREGSDRLATVEPAADSERNQTGLTFNHRRSGFSKSGPGVVHPKLKESTPASFPLSSLLAKEDGTTTMSYCVSSQGRVRDVKVTVSSGYKRLDAAAVDWLQSREYEPGTIEDAPTEMCGLIDYRWRLD